MQNEGLWFQEGFHPHLKRKAWEAKQGVPERVVLDTVEIKLMVQGSKSKIARM